MIVPRARLLLFVILLLPLTVMAAAIPETGSACLAIGFLAAATVIGDALASRDILKGIEIQLSDIVRCSKDREAEIEIQIRSRSQKKLQLRFGIPVSEEITSLSDTILIELPEGSENSRAIWNVTPLKRGKYQISRCYFETHSILGFWNIRASLPVKCELRVYPNLMEERKKIAALFLNRGDFGVHAQRMVGQGREFEKLREYIAGDGYDQVHWKATAKRGKPVTKVFQIERTQEVFVVIDFSRLSAKTIRGETTLEHYLRASLVLGMVAQRQGDLFGLITFSDKVHSFLRASSGKAHFQTCRDALYMLQPRIVTPDFDELCSFIRLRLRRRALLVFLTDLSDPLLAENFARSSGLISKQHLILVNMVRAAGVEQWFAQPNANSIDALYQNLSGHLLWQNLRELRNVLHRQGTTFYQLNDAKMSADLVTEYLNVKQRQLI
ncbi:MAG: DUF58 domain-containing protein [Acidobacteria bacterium]|nr:MAG: DUF58 domain-containing protein [Acidobacteriota bacterium]